MKNCIHCRKPVIKKNKLHKGCYDDFNFLIDNTPIYFCPNCFEEYLNFKTLDKIDNFLDNQDNYNFITINDKTVMIDFNELL